MTTSLRGVLALLTVIGCPVLFVEAVRAEPEIAELGQPEIAEPEGATTLSATDPNVESEAVTADWQAQIEAVQITGIRVESTEAGLQVTIEADGELAAPTQSTSGNAVVLEIPNATLAEPVQEFEPAKGIALVQASTLPGDIVRLAITGSDALPVVNISAAATGLVLGVTPGIAQAGAEDDAIQLVVTGEEDGYAVPNATTGTRTDTPLRDTPQSVQVIPQEVLEDQGVTDLNDALRNVSGVVATANDPRGPSFRVRGFGGLVLRDGLRLENSLGFAGFAELSNIERIEVLKGPASILSGAVAPGGAVNLITEHPLSEPTYELGLRLGNRRLIEPSLDFSGPLTEDGRLLYRINALVRREDYFRDFEADVTRSFFAPTLSWAISDQTDLLVEFEYRDDERPFDRGLPNIGTRVAPIPFERALTYPDVTTTSEATRVGYRFEHRFSDNWKVRNTAYYNRSDSLAFFDNGSGFDGVDTVTLSPGNFALLSERVDVQTNIVGEFATGDLEHTLLAGVDFSRRQDSGEITIAAQLVTIPFVGTVPVPTITDTLNIFNPDYDSLTSFDPSTFIPLISVDNLAEGLGLYVQDQIQLSDNLIVLAGLRYDTVYQEQTTESPTLTALNGQDISRNDAFTHRLGLVYQPSDEISLYTSYSTSFQPNTLITFENALLDPQEGEQIEVGVRAELLEGNLVANLALFDIDRTNLPIQDPLNPNFVIADGGQNVQGIELDVIGEILPGWNVVANYAYLDAEVTSSDNATAIGNRFPNVPEHNLNLWTNYTLQDGPLAGLSLGIGGNFVGERFGDDNNTIVLESYFLTNAVIGYERDNWQAALNFRNLFDTDYIESSVSQGRVQFPGAGFTVVGSFSIEF